jgi:TP901 family phage tail tape measure protein
MNITVRVLSRQAQAQLAAVQTQMRGVNAATAAGAAGATAFSGALNDKRLMRWGNQLQWTGRQLQYNWTLPLAIAAGAAGKWALDNEKAFTKVAKVYGDFSMSTQTVKNELHALEGAFEALSNRFGIQQKEVIEVGAAWAAAGASGIGLAKSTETTLRAMILGEMDSVKATQAMISIQAQYQFSSAQLSDTLAQLNIIENQTGISLAGLIEGFSRASGTARSAGVDTRHLGAMLAAITPAAGTAAQAGNALKTMISRLMSPTKEAVEVLGLMGVNTADLAWKSLNASQRLELMSKKFANLDDAQKAVVSSTIASRWQINKFDVLMREMTSTTGFYQRALDATADRTLYLKQAQKELDTVLNSSPQRLKIIWTILQNGAADIVQPMIPLFLALANSVKAAVQWFSNLDPGLQKLILAFAVLVAAIGPVTRYIGSLITLFGTLGLGFVRVAGAVGMAARFMGSFLLLPFQAAGTAIAFMGGQMIRVAVASVPLMGRALMVLATGPMFTLRYTWAAVVGAVTLGMRAMLASVVRGMAALGAAMLGPWGIAIAAVIGLTYAFRNQIGQIWKNVVEYFQSGGGALAAAFSPVVQFFQRAVGAIEQAFYRLPEGVQNAILAVVRVVASAAQQVYEWLSYLNPFARHSPSLVDSVKAGMRIIKDEFGDIKVISGPLDAAKAKLKSMQAAIDAQENVVQAWKGRMDEAADHLRDLEKVLDTLQARLTAVSDQLDAAKQRIQDFANTPIAGMRAMEDQIFANEQAQKRLRLEILKMEQAGHSVQDVTDRLAKLQAGIELARGTQNDLRAAGAGSDITGVYQKQINQLEAQQRVIVKTGDPITKLQQELEKLQRTGEILDLEKSLKFDPLTRQIDQLANGMKELPFSQIIAGIKSNQAEVTRLQAAYDKAKAAVDRQKAAVDAYKVVQERINEAHEREVRKLDALRDAYQKYSDQIREAEQALNDLEGTLNKRARAAKAKKAKQNELSPGAQNFLDAAGGNFPEVGGTTGIGREMPNIKDQSALIDKFTQDLAKQTGDMFGQFDLFKPIRDGWNKTWAWITTNIGPVVKGVIDFFRAAFSNVANPFSGLTNQTKSFLDNFKGLWHTFTGWLGHVWDLVGPLIKGSLDSIWQGLKGFWKQVGPELVRFKEILQPVGDAIKKLWFAIKPVIGLFLVGIGLIVSVVWNMLNGAIRPVFEMLGGIIAGVLKVVVGLIKIFAALITGDWKGLWDGVRDVVTGVWKIISAIFVNAFKIIGGLIKGFVKGIVDWFKWLWNMLVGHSIVPDMIKAIVDWFKRMPKMVLDAVIVLVKALGKWAYDSLNNAWNNFRNRWNATIAWAKGLPSNFYATVAVLITKLGKWAYDGLMNAWNNFKNRWSATISWAKGLPTSFYNSVAGLIGKLGTLGRDAFNNFYNSMRAIWSNNISPWFSRLPGAAGKALSGIGGAVAGAVRGAVKGAFDWMNKNVIGNINKVVKPFGVTIPSLPHFAKGGVIPGQETRKDSVLIAARPGEGILIPEAVRGLGGKQGIEFLNKMFRRGHPAAGFEQMQDPYQHFDLGGVVSGGLKAAAGVASSIKSHIEDWIAQGAGFALDHLLAPVGGAIRGVMPNGFAEDFIAGVISKWRAAARAWGDKTEAAGFGGISLGTGSFGTSTILSVKRWIAEQLGEPYVWGATGPNSWDCSGLVGAVYGLLRGIAGAGNGARFFTTGSISTAVPGLKAGMGPGLNIGVTAGTGHMAGNLAGLPFEATPPRVRIGSSAAPVIRFARKYHMDGGPTISASGSRGRAFDSGGILPPGYTLAWNGTGRKELVLTPQMVAAISRALGGGTGGSKSAGGRHMGRVLGAAWGRADAAGGAATWGGRVSGETHLHFHGDLSFPNIKKSGDASEFIKNLEAMAND